MTTTKYSISAASRITSKSRTTISKHIKEGKLSIERDSNDRPVIDASELIRFYGDACDFESEEGSVKSPPISRASRPSRADQSAHHQVTTVQDRLDQETQERQREREQLQARIDSLEESLNLSQEGHNRATLLLEHRLEGGGELQRSLKALEARMANQEQQAGQERDNLKRQALRYKSALQREKSKTVWQKLFA